MNMDRLYLENAGLLVKLANRYRRACHLDRAVSREDLMQAGFLGLVRAQETWDENGGKSWTSWAAWHISDQMKQALGLRRRYPPPWQGAHSLDAPPHPGADVPLRELLPDECRPNEARLLAEERARALRAALDGLPAPLGQVLRLKYLKSLSVAQTAAQLGIPPEQIPALEAQGLKRLRRSDILRNWRDETS